MVSWDVLVSGCHEVLQFTALSRPRVTRHVSTQQRPELQVGLRQLGLEEAGAKRTTAVLLPVAAPPGHS